MAQRFLFYHVKQLNAAVIGGEQMIKPFVISNRLGMKITHLSIYTFVGAALAAFFAAKAAPTINSFCSGYLVIVPMPGATDKCRNLKPVSANVAV